MYNQVRVSQSKAIARAAAAILRGQSVYAAQDALQEAGDYAAAMILKASVSPIGLDAGDALLVQTVISDFIASVAPMTILGRLRERRLAPFERPLPVVGISSTALWVGGAQPAPVSALALKGEALKPTKVSTISVFSRELFRSSNVEDVVDAELRAALTSAIDLAFIDPDSAGVADVKPAAITHGVTPLAGTGDPAEDLAELFQHFDGNLMTSYIVMNPRSAVRLALHRDSGGAYAFPDAGPRGGSVLGVPLLTSNSVPFDSSGGTVALIDASSVVVAEDAITLDASDEASVQMDDAPDSPSTASTVLTSLWQENLRGVRATHAINWNLARSRAVAVLTGENW